MTKEEFLELCLAYPDAVADCPFQKEKDTMAVRHRNSKKWFALLIMRKGRQCANLKLEPMKADFLRGVYRGIENGWHMNHTHWSTLFLESDVPREIIEEMVSESYHLTKKA
ncbi:MAG: MmcQ/YjbR family DNA-binding protein [Oscillospiraceae bacterium]